MMDLEIVDNAKKSGDNNVLLMLSGGRDSFLATCRLIEQGFYVHMITYDNGCMSNVEAAGTVAERIIKRYGTNRASFEGIYNIATYLWRLQQKYLYQTIEDSSKKYPFLQPAQLPCLACHTGMYIESIAFCKAHNISFIAEGARKIQNFFVELEVMVNRYRALLHKYDIELILPVYNLEDDWERKQELADRGFVPKTLEPQCWLGCPMKQGLTEQEQKSLADYYDNEIEPKLEDWISASLLRKKACDESSFFI